MKRKLTKEELIREYESGKTAKEVARFFGVCDETIRKANIAFGINYIQDYTAAGKFKKEYPKNKLIQLYKDGWSLAGIERHFGISAETVASYNQKLGINIEDYYEYRVDYDVHVFDKIDTEEKAYWIGFWYADGNVREKSNEMNLHLSAVDYEHLLKFKDFMKDTRDESVIRRYNRTSASGNLQEMANYQICNSNLKASMLRLGCIPKKSLILTFPDISIFEDPNLVYDFIRGYVDGDGCLCENRKRLALSVRGTKDFLEGIVNFFPEFKSVYSEIDKRTGNIQFRIGCSHDKADKVATKLYSKAKVFLNRKYLKYTELCRNV